MGYVEDVMDELVYLGRDNAEVVMGVRGELVFVRDKGIETVVSTKLHAVHAARNAHVALIQHAKYAQKDH